MLHIEEHYLGYFLVILFIFVLFATPTFLYAAYEPIGLYTNDYYASNGGVAFDFYPSGYSDGWYWGYSDRHQQDSHEMLSGEWASGIFYNGIHDNKTQWLTDWFMVPNWPTYTSFIQDPNFEVWNHKTARSRVYDSNVRVTIDYNLIDIGDSNYVSLPFRNFSGNIKDVNSEQYILLQTYTIENNSPNNITGLEFYQMLHGHPADKWGRINSTYSDVNYPNTLKDPCDPAKTFRYAITQWNLGDPNTEHVDWISFSSTIQPDWIDNGTYNGHDEEPTSGTHIRVENRALNGARLIYYDEAAGAMGYNLGTLTPGQSTSITFAVMFGSGNVQFSEPNVWNITRGTHFNTIQGAIEDPNTTDNDVIVAYPALYKENVSFGNKLLTLQSSDPNNPSIVASTIISGNNYNDTVTFTDNNSTINGFTITDGGSGGVNCYSYGSSCSPTVKNCIIRDNGNGVLCNYSSAPAVANCVIRDNGAGVYCETDSAPTIANCIIKDNLDIGIYCYYTKQVKILNNWIVNNGASLPNCYGVVVDSTNNEVTIRNNTISNNTSGIYYDGYGTEPNISNCIIWNNKYYNLYREDEQPFNNVTYSCINGGYGDSSKHNISFDPCFVNADISDYHLKSISPCIDTGDPNFNSSTGKDIDGENRIMDGDSNGSVIVDIGADEFCPFDLSPDGFVNFLDFAVFARSWGKSAGDANYNYLCDFSHNNKIDFNDLAIFCSHWLWPSDWNDIGGEGAYFEQMSGEGEGESMEMQPEQEFMMESQEELTPAIYLICDNNTPEPNEEVTVQIYSDAPLFCMGLGITVTGDAEITDAMSTADCNEYGWDPDWPTDPYIDPDEGWLYVSGVKWDGGAEGVVGYFKFRYNSGQVSVSIMEDSEAYDSDCEPVGFSTEALTFESDPNE